MKPFEPWVGYLGIGMLLMFVYMKWTDWQFRKRAVAVRGEVLKIFPHSKFTSYFLAYEHQGQRHIAEYRGLPLVPEYKVGDAFEVEIDGQAPPDVPLPDKTHVVWFGGTATCWLPGFSWFSLGNALWVGTAIFLVVHGLLR